MMRLGLWRHNSGLYFFKKAHPSMSGKMRCILSLVIVTSIVSLSFSYFESRIRPNFNTVCQSQVALFGNKLINSCVMDSFKGNDGKGVTVEDGSFSTIKRDQDGNVKSFQTNTITLNRYSSEIATMIYDKITNINESTVTIPLGSVLTDSILFSRAGPNIKIKLKPVGFADVNYESHFVSAGINQVKHEVILKVKLTLIAYMLPGVSTKVTVQSNVPIDQTIIMGNVPNFYGSLGGNSSK
jgi:sporulation protein YunB